MMAGARRAGFPEPGIRWNRDEVAWAAGFFEGEGSVKRGGKGKWWAHARLGNTDFDVLDRFQRAVKFGIVYGPYPNRQKKGYKDYGVWRSHHHELTQQLVALFWPWLGERRREQARRALIANRQRPAMQTHKLSPAIAREIRARYQPGT